MLAAKFKHIMIGDFITKDGKKLEKINESEMKDCDSGKISKFDKLQVLYFDRIVNIVGRDISTYYPNA